MVLHREKHKININTESESICFSVTGLKQLYLLCLRCERKPFMKLHPEL